MATAAAIPEMPPGTHNPGTLNEVNRLLWRRGYGDFLRGCYAPPLFEHQRFLHAWRQGWRAALADVLDRQPPPHDILVLDQYVLQHAIAVSALNAKISLHEDTPAP